MEIKLRHNRESNSVLFSVFSELKTVQTCLMGQKTQTDNCIYNNSLLQIYSKVFTMNPNYPLNLLYLSSEHLERNKVIVHKELEIQLVNILIIFVFLYNDVVSPDIKAIRRINSALD